MQHVDLELGHGSALEDCCFLHHPIFIPSPSHLHLFIPFIQSSFHPSHLHPSIPSSSHSSCLHPIFTPSSSLPSHLHLFHPIFISSSPLPSHSIFIPSSNLIQPILFIPFMPSSAHLSQPMHAVFISFIPSSSHSSHLHPIFIPSSPIHTIFISTQSPVQSDLHGSSSSRE